MHKLKIILGGLILENVVAVSVQQPSVYEELASNADELSKAEDSQRRESVWCRDLGHFIEGTSTYISHQLVSSIHRKDDDHLVSSLYSDHDDDFFMFFTRVQERLF